MGRFKYQPSYTFSFRLIFLNKFFKIIPKYYFYKNRKNSS